MSVLQLQDYLGPLDCRRPGAGGGCQPVTPHALLCPITEAFPSLGGRGCYSGPRNPAVCLMTCPSCERDRADLGQGKAGPHGISGSPVPSSSRRRRVSCLTFFGGAGKGSNYQVATVPAKWVAAKPGGNRRRRHPARPPRRCRACPPPSRTCWARSRRPPRPHLGPGAAPSPRAGGAARGKARSWMLGTGAGRCPHHGGKRKRTGPRDGGSRTCAARGRGAGRSHPPRRPRPSYGRRAASGVDTASSGCRPGWSGDAGGPLPGQTPLLLFGTRSHNVSRFPPPPPIPPVPLGHTQPRPSASCLSL